MVLNILTFTFLDSRWDDKRLWWFIIIIITKCVFSPLNIVHNFLNIMYLHYVTLPAKLHKINA
jgi:hypothetical protein